MKHMLDNLYECATHPRGLIRAYTSGLSLDYYCRFLMAKEWGNQWHWYIPRGGLEGKTVLDIGAGCGETTYLFLEHGAKEVIAIEPDLKRVAMFRRNMWRFNWKATLYGRRFEPSDLDIPHDFLKADMEGYEQLMLDRPEKIRPCTLEVHTHYLRERFEVLGFRQVETIDKGVGKGLMINW